MSADDEVTARTANANVAFCRLRTNVWDRNGIRFETKLIVYKAVVLPTLLYVCGNGRFTNVMLRDLSISI